MTISQQSVEKIKEAIILPISKEYYSLFHKEGVDISSDDLNKLINRSFKNAVNNFHKLNLSKTYYLSAYVAYWIREELIKVFIIKTSRKVSLREDNPRESQDLKAIRNFFSLLPLGSSAFMEQRLFKSPSLVKRKNIFGQYQKLFDKLRKPFEDLVGWRNILVQKKRYPNYISYIRQKDQIPNEEYELFIKSVDQIISYCYAQLPKVENLPCWFYSQYNQPCFLCLMPFPKELSTEKVLDIVVGLYPQLKAFLPKIRIIYTNKARTRYLKENDLFKMSIRKNVNQRHQMIDLVHELGHVIYFIDSFANNVDILKCGKYIAEKAALRVVFKVLNSIDPRILKAYYADLLQVIRRSLFELAIYTEPIQNYDFLYARLFRKCFPCSSQRSNPLYLLDERIVEQPLTSLPFTVASVNLLSLTLGKTPEI